MVDGDSDGGDGGLNVVEENPYLPSIQAAPAIPHYYGDYVRQIFMFCGALMLVFAPFLASSAPGALPFEVGGALIVAILGGLTDPKKKISMLANGMVAGVGVVTYELLALNALYSGAMLAFIEREVLVIAFLFALYFSLKTFRNMMSHLVGKKNRFGEFVDTN